MKQTIKLFAAVLSLLCAYATGQTSQAPPAPSPTQTDVYHVHFNKAALGKAGDLGQSLSSGDPKAPMPGHFIVLRHQEGDDWDYCVIEHLGKSATVDAAPSAMTPVVRDQSAWHTDTFVSGPSWAEFTKAMGTDQPAGKSGGGIYIVSVYRAAPGHRDQVEQMFKTNAPAKVPVGNVLMQHLEGGPWNFLTVARYNSWQDLATDRSAPPNTQGWNQTREHVAFHHDTIADRIAPK